MRYRGIRIATQADVRALIDRCLVSEEAGRSVVEAYRTMRAAGSFAGFWSHIDDLAKALPAEERAQEAMRDLTENGSVVALNRLDLPRGAPSASGCRCHFDSAAGMFVPLASCPVHGRQVTP